ncbi:MAG: hypothetical protein ACRC6R_08375 [Bacteroidales bacterium]
MMKRKLFGLIFAAAVATPLVTLTSCSDDDKTKVVPSTPFIKVYNTEISFNEEMTQATIQGIVSNVEFEVLSYPSWIESVTLKAENGGEFYTAIVLLKASDFDDEKREGVITFKDKSSDYTSDYTIVCEPSNFSLRVSWADEFNDIFDSNASVEGAITKAIVNITSKPGEDVQLRAFERIGFRFSEEPSEFVTITEVPASTRAAYNVKSYEVSFATYSNDNQWNPVIREFRIYPIPVAHLEIFNPNNTGIQDYKDVRQHRDDIVRFEDGLYISVPNEGASIDVTFQATEECEVSLGELEYDMSVTPPSFSDYSIVKKSESEIIKGRRTYVYTLTMSKCPDDLEWGRGSNVVIVPTSNINESKTIPVSQDGWY